MKKNRIDVDDVLFFGMIGLLFIIPIPSLFYFGSVLSITCTGFTGLFVLFAANALFNKKNTDALDDLALLFFGFSGVATLVLCACHTFYGMAHA